MTQENVIVISSILAELAGLLKTERGDKLNGQAQSILLAEYGKINAEVEYWRKDANAWLAMAQKWVNNERLYLNFCKLASASFDRMDRAKIEARQ